MDSTGVLTCFLVIFIVNIKASLISTKVDLCGPIMELILDRFDESAATVALASNEYGSLCKLKIIAPKTHVIYLNIVETTTFDPQNVLVSISRMGSCHLNVYQENNPEPVWSGDPCSDQTLPDIDLLYPEVTLEWSPPHNSSYSKGKKLLVTAVGRGDTCKSNLQHTCMSIGHEPLFCVSKYLLCDGNNNCPRGATRNDEDHKICKVALSIMLKRFTNSEINDKILNLLMSKTTKTPKVKPIWHDWTYIQRGEVTTLPPTTTTEEEETQTSNIESLSAALSHYGPWGYILLGMLICGTVLMFCGVWECFRKPKPPAEATQSSPTTVLIINQPDENNPPRYEDIDPPSYSTLFPNMKPNDSPQPTDNSSGTSETNTSQQPTENISNDTSENQNDDQVTSSSTTVDIAGSTAIDSNNASVSDINVNVPTTSCSNSPNNEVSLSSVA